MADNLDQAIDIANEIAPEHLELAVDNPFDHLSKIRNAGSIFLGKYCPEALGDYWAGPNHTLPTMGTARFSSPLSVDDFIKKSSFTYYTADAFPPWPMTLPPLPRAKDCGPMAVRCRFAFPRRDFKV